MTRTTAILLTALLPALFSVNASPETDLIDEQVAQIQADFDVTVHYQYETNLFFPAEWLEPTLALSASEIEPAEATRLLPLIRQFLAAHPVTVVKGDLEHIYLLKELSFRGKKYGSTHVNSKIYLICDGVANRYDDDFISCRLHSEFSSILLEHHAFPTNRWTQFNPAGFRYSGNGFEMVDNPSCYDSTVRSCTDGFLVNYCRSSLENDFNIISAWLFTKSSELDALALQHDRIREKRALAKQFYLSLSPLYVFE